MRGFDIDNFSLTALLRRLAWRRSSIVQHVAAGPSRDQWRGWALFTTPLAAHSAVIIRESE
jgi:hypothetical protein